MTEAIIFIFGIFISGIFFTSVWIYLRMMTESVSTKSFELVKNNPYDAHPSFQVMDTEFKQNHFNNNIMR